MMGKMVEKVGFGGAFLLLSVIAYVILGIYDFALLRNALYALAGLIARIAPVLLLVFGMMFLTNLFFEGNRIARFLGKGSGLRGWMVAIAGGIASSGPIYMWYPMLSDLKEKGMKDSLIAAFLYNRAVKIASPHDGLLFRMELRPGAVSLYGAFFRDQWNAVRRVAGRDRKDENCGRGGRENGQLRG